MKIDVDTVNVLKNFAKINPSIVVAEGNVLKTISPTKAIMAKATVKTEFSQRFAIYNLDRFISTLSLFTDPELKFKDQFVDISDENRKTHYVYADESTVTKAPDREIKLPSVEVSFKLKNDALRDVEKAAGVLGLPQIVVVGDGKNIKLQAEDVKNPTGDVYSVVIGESDKVFKAIFKAENIKIIPGDYEVSISSRGISQFVGNDVEYFIAIEKNSTF